ncbi:type 2 lanthipeptide synthetase LanM family protein [Pigmentiphaga litoralis]|uniref:type 2 lanthipeptide synthetase LanM family protein n=1 Tax=Pigmentiphaga litoralis TaxID=516702 RepID=UPI003B42CB76
MASADVAHAMTRHFAASIEHSALTIDEVLSDDYEPLPAQAGDHALARKRLDRWITLCADNDPSVFEQRLARLNWARQTLLARLAGVRRRDHVKEPFWVSKTRHVLDVLLQGGINPAQQQLAFSPLLSPLVEDAVRVLRRSLPIDVSAIMTSRAFEGIVDHLRMRLGNLCELPFYDALLHWRRGLLSAAQGGDAAALAQLSDDSLDGFAEHMRTTGYAALFDQTPVLFRLIATLICQWQSSYRLFLLRLADDRPALQTWLPLAQNDALVSRVNWGLSDPHNEGLSVLGVEFSDGTKVLYKPKDLRPDTFVIQVVGELIQLGLPEQLLLPKALVREGYGWTTHIPPAACGTVDDVDTYYRRFGTWLAVFHLLSTSDMHMENFVASGAHPVPVDVEMILQGIRQRPRAVDEHSEAHWLATHALEKSVQSVGMLPAYVQGQNGGLISMGALEPSVYPVKVLKWDSINTPRMLLASQTDHIEINTNLPVLDGHPISVGRHKEAFFSGFVSTLRFIAGQERAGNTIRKALDAPPFIIRKVVRPTRFYYMLLKRLYDHRAMHDSVCWSMEADFVARFYDWEDHAERPWKLAASERRQLLDLGIPHFVMHTDANVISDGRGPVTRLHVELGHDVVRRRMTTLGPQEIAIQSDIVRACLQMPPTQASAFTDVQPGLPFVQMLGDALMSSSLRAESSVAWIGLTRVDHEVAAQLAPLGHDLYYGATGIAVFLAALALSGSPMAATDCRQVLAATMQTVRSARLAQLRRAIGIGGAVGLGSIVYGLTLTGEALADDGMLEAAASCASGITPEAIMDDRTFDLVGGASGACLALIALHRRRSDERLLERAVLCCDHLLAHREAKSGMWRSSAIPLPLTGVAHGAAGIALAFSRVYGLTGYERFRVAAQDCIAFEARHFDVVVGNWKDLRAGGDQRTPRPPNQWCYGAVGIGLARLSMLKDDAVPCHVLNEDVDRALAATLADQGGRNSSLCCGDAGHIEFLVEVAGQRGRGDLMDVAQARAAALSNTWRRTGDLVWNGGHATWNPGLFQGVAGVGFSGLRALGIVLPSPLAWL